MKTIMFATTFHSFGWKAMRYEKQRQNPLKKTPFLAHIATQTIITTKGLQTRGLPRVNATFLRYVRILWLSCLSPMFCLECLRCRVHVVSFNSFSLFSMRRSFRSQIHSFKGFFPSIPKSIYAHCTRFNHNSEFLNSMFSQIFWVLATHTHTKILSSNGGPITTIKTCNIHFHNSFFQLNFNSWMCNFRAGEKNVPIFVVVHSSFVWLFKKTAKA